MKSFIICIKSTSDWYKEDDIYDELKGGKHTPVGISLKYHEGSLIEQGDLVFIVQTSKTKSSLVAVGRTITDYNEDPNIEGILIQLDFIQKRGKEFSIFQSLLEEGGIVLTRDIYELPLAPDFTEKLMKTLALHIMINSTQETACYIHNPKLDVDQLLCDYLNEFCPEFREEVIKRFTPVYKNYKEGEIIDKDLIDLTYDKSVTRFPGLVLDWNLLFDIVRPRA